MTTFWNCFLHHQEYGPLNEEQLKEMAEQGQLTPQTLLRPAQSADAWAPLAHHPLPAVLGAFSEPLDVGSSSGVQMQPPPVQTPPVQTPPVQTPPVQTAPVQTAPVQTAPVQTAPVQTPPVQTAPVQTAPIEVAPVQVAMTPAQQAPVQPVMQQPAIVQPAIQQPAMVQAAAQPAGQLPMGTAVVAPAPAASEEGSEDPRLRFVRRKKNTLPLIIGLSIAAVLGMIALFVVLNGGGDDPPPSGEGDQPVAKAEPTPKVDPEASDPVTKSNPKAPVGDAPLDRSEGIRWGELGNTQKLGSTVSIKVESVWLADGAAGQELHAQVRLTYLASTPVKYSSWQGTGAVGKTAGAVLLLPAAGGLPKRLQRAIPPASPTVATTLTRSKQVTEILVFPAPAETDEIARLMLPREAIGRTGAPFGVELTRASWLAGVHPETVTEPPSNAIDPAPGTGPPSGGAPGTVVTEPAAPPPADPDAPMAPDGTPKKTDDDKPPSVREINEQIRQMKKKAEEAAKQAQPGTAS